MRHAPNEPIKAPRGTELNCKAWPQETAYRLLMNNLEVAENWKELVVYGGRGKAARTWDCYYAIVDALKELGNDETLIVQSGKPVAVWKTHTWAPRVLISNAMLVPFWSTEEHFNELDRKGLTMFGQMTAGSWCNIGSQGIVQGTYETFATIAAMHFGGSLKGRLTLTGGLGMFSGIMPHCISLNGGVSIGVEVDPDRIKRRKELGFIHDITNDPDDALARARAAAERGEALSVALQGNIDLRARHAERLRTGRHDAERSTGAPQVGSRGIHAACSRHGGPAGGGHGGISAAWGDRVRLWKQRSSAGVQRRL
jgi:urocanate hydratase